MTLNALWFTASFTIFSWDLKSNPKNFCLFFLVNSRIFCSQFCLFLAFSHSPFCDYDFLFWSPGPSLFSVEDYNFVKRSLFSTTIFEFFWRYIRDKTTVLVWIIDSNCLSLSFYFAKSLILWFSLSLSSLLCVSFSLFLPSCVFDLSTLSRRAELIVH